MYIVVIVARIRLLRLNIILGNDLLIAINLLLLLFENYLRRREREVFIPFEFSSLPRESLTINNNDSRYWNSFKYNLISREKKIILENV